MAVEFGGRDVPFLAGEDLSAMQYRYVMQSDDGTVVMHDDGTEISAGILQNAPASGEEAVVRVEGTSKLVANAAIAVGILVKAEYVGASDNGKADAADTDGDIARGLTLTASGAEDDVLTVLLCVSKISVPA